MIFWGFEGALQIIYKIIIGILIIIGTLPYHAQLARSTAGAPFYIVGTTSMQSILNRIYVLRPHI